MGSNSLQGLRNTSGTPLKIGSQLVSPVATAKVIDYIENHVFALEYEYTEYFTKRGIFRFEVKSVDGRTRLTVRVEFLGPRVILFLLRIVWPYTWLLVNLALVIKLQRFKSRIKQY